MEWSHDSERIAVVTRGHLRVFSRAGELFGQFEGEFGDEAGGYWLNPRWSSDDRHLFLDDMPASGGELAYLFSADAEPLFRFFIPSFAGGCGGEPWIDAGTLEFGEYDVRIDGTFELHGRQRRDVWSIGRLGVTLAEGISYHLPQLGLRDGYGVLDDGRIAFSTATWTLGGGGCGSGWGGSSETEPAVEWPPFEANR
ncbi:MAG: hypothetical protein DWG75_01125 [Chloroflexi bacterium]|nr:hypothetical protein [Chloroflexota bacterium]